MGLKDRVKYVLDHVRDQASGKIPVRSRRSGKWSSTRDSFLKENPRCAVCNGKSKLSVHHIKPFHLFPELELDRENLITLCEVSGRNCHLTFGHLLNFQSHNPDVKNDALLWSEKIKKRPPSKT